MLLGVGLMVAEAHIGAFGVIGIGGIIAFVIGASSLLKAAVVFLDSVQDEVDCSGQALHPRSRRYR